MTVANVSRRVGLAVLLTVGGALAQGHTNAAARPADFAFTFHHGGATPSESRQLDCDASGCSVDGGARRGVTEAQIESVYHTIVAHHFTRIRSQPRHAHSSDAASTVVTVTSNRRHHTVTVDATTEIPQSATEDFDAITSAIDSLRDALRAQ